MSSTFVFDRYVTGKNHLGRSEELGAMAQAIQKGENVLLCESAGFGKSSLIAQTLQNLAGTGTIVSELRISLLSVRSAENLALTIAGDCISSFYHSSAEIEAAVTRLLPNFAFSSFDYASSRNCVKLATKADAAILREAFRLPYLLAEEFDKRILLVFEEFQSVAFVDEKLKVMKIFEDAVREASPKQKKLVNIVFSGSQVNAMKGLFAQLPSSSKLATRIKLSPIPKPSLCDHVIKGFLVSGKVIERYQIQEVCDRLRSDACLVNHFASICDGLTKGYVTEAVLDEAMEELIGIHEPHFINTVSDLTNFQIRLLKAILDGHKRFSTSEVIENYQLNSSANVHRLKEALCKKEIISFEGDDEPIILDALFEYWLKTIYFAKM